MQSRPCEEPSPLTLSRRNTILWAGVCAFLEALRQAVRENPVSGLRQFALLALNAAGGGDAATFDVALRDDDPQVRRLAVIGSRRWVDDPSPIVRLETLRQAGTCERALAAVADVSGHVALAAVDFLGS